MAFPQKMVTVVGIRISFILGFSKAHRAMLDPVRPFAAWIMYIDTALVSLALHFELGELQATHRGYCRILSPSWLQVAPKTPPWHDIGRLKESFAGHNVELRCWRRLLSQTRTMRGVALVSLLLVTLVPMLLVCPLRARYGAALQMQYGPV